MLAGGVVNGERLDSTLSVTKRFGRFLRRHGLDEPARLAEAGLLRGSAGNTRLFVSVVGVDRVTQMLAALLDPAEFLSPHGLRSLSARHRAHPAVLQFGGFDCLVNTAAIYPTPEPGTWHCMSVMTPRRSAAGGRSSKRPPGSAGAPSGT